MSLSEGIIFYNLYDTDISNDAFRPGRIIPRVLTTPRSAHHRKLYVAWCYCLVPIFNL
jgi:hypothetical protein